MTISTPELLGIMGAYGIVPEESFEEPDLPEAPERDFPETGEIEEGETVYSTSISEVFRDIDGPMREGLDVDEPRIREWRDEIESIIRTGRDNPWQVRREPRREPPEPHCAWYCPIHFFGHGWGIYIRERCILSITKDIARFVDWNAVGAAAPSITRQLLRSAFYAFFLHEQFHHKVESLGLRFLISTGSDRYRPYKARVYRRTYLTADCLEESLANAESYRRLTEPRYKERVDVPIRDGVRRLLRASFSVQPPGYKEGLNYLGGPPYRSGLNRLQSQTLNGTVSPNTPVGHWSAAPGMITALTDITDEIYVVLPIGARPIFRPTSVDPGYTASSRAVELALTKHYGYKLVPGGKGSHLKFSRPGAQTIIIPGNRPVLSPGVVKHVLGAIGNFPISRVRAFLEGRL